VTFIDDNRNCISLNSNNNENDIPYPRVSLGVVEVFHEASEIDVKQSHSKEPDGLEQDEMLDTKPPAKGTVLFTDWIPDIPSKVPPNVRRSSKEEFLDRFGRLRHNSRPHPPMSKYGSCFFAPIIPAIIFVVLNTNRDSYLHHQHI